MKVLAEFLKKTNRYLDKTGDPKIQLNLQFLRTELLTFIEGYPFKGFYYPVRFEFNKSTIILRKVN